jgi:hypothetical protein
LVFDPNKSVTLHSTGNITVLGLLIVHPARARIEHKVVFEGVNERDYVGGGCNALSTDVGLWVKGAGRIDLIGTERLPWARAATHLHPGMATITLDREARGWRKGDELAITPTLPPTAGDPTATYDIAVVASVRGRDVTLHRPLRYSHPRVSPGRGMIFGAEVLNLTRNVRIEGTPGRRAHVLISARAKQRIVQTSLRHLGPRQGPGGNAGTSVVLGRYMLHFHGCGDGSRGSLVEAVVARDGGSHAFVPHASHGVTFRRCISHDTCDDPYWWDLRPSPRVAAAPTDDTLWEHCVASLVRCDPPFRGYRMSGFTLGVGYNNKAIGNVAVGVLGNKTAAGFVWPESGSGLWQFTGNVAHNNRANGGFVWQNNGSPHLINEFVSYHNGGAGIEHGAYRNGYRYQSATLYGNRIAALVLHATSRSESMRFDDTVFDGANMSGHVVVTGSHRLPALAPVVFSNSTFKNYRSSAVRIGSAGGQVREPDRLDFVSCAFAANEFWFESELHPDSVVRVQDTHRSAIKITPGHSSNTVWRSMWNAGEKRIEPFSGTIPVARFDPGAKMADQDICD